MKKYLMQIAAFSLVLVLLLQIFANNGLIAAAASTPSLTKKTLALRGIGDEYDINIKNKVAKSTYAWTSSNSKVATVTKKGLVTAGGAGSAVIKCKITYPSKKTKTLSCKVTVQVPATAIHISELTMVNNAYQLALGGKVTLSAAILPENSTDVAYWYIDENNTESDPECITLDSGNQGIVTGVKKGKAVVRVRAARAATKASAESSDIDDAIIIEVVEPTAEVSSVEAVSSNQFVVKFNSPVQKSTVINTDGTLSSNITVTLCYNIKKVLAADPGKLTASLSNDNLTLTITTANTLDGIYGLDFSGSILTTSGIALESYYKQVTYTDETPPAVSGTTYDASGVIATITFTEEIDFSNFTVSATPTNSSVSVNATSLAILNNVSNYIISSDKKSVYINLANISSDDYGKLFSVVLSGLKDLAGNAPDSKPTVYLVADGTPRAQAKPVSVVRTGYYTLTATFDRAIKTAGILSVTGGGTYTGVVDSDDIKKVNYTISSAEASYTGARTVSIGYWSGYNVISTDTSANQMTAFTVNFSVDSISPYITAYEYDTSTNILKITCSEAVTAASSTGILIANLATASGDTLSGQTISYTVLTHSLGDNILELKLTFSALKTGDYTFTLDQGFAIDSYYNKSVSKQLVISNSSGISELSGPYMVTQSPTSLNEITLMFADKLDVASATTVSNYQITGLTVLSASLTSNTADAGATVVLTVLSIDTTVDRILTITGVKGYNNSYSAIASYTTTITLKENVAPYYIDPPVFDSSSKQTVKLNFSETIQGSLIVTVTQIYAGASTVISNTVTVSGNIAYIKLGAVPTNGSYLKITIEASYITDTSGNSATFSKTTLGVLASY